jgi:hypothetical protein
MFELPCGTYDVRKKTETAKSVHGSLGRPGLLLAVQVGHQRDVDACKVGVPNPELELAHRFDKRSRLDVTYGPAEL